MPKSESIGHSWRPLARALTSGIALLLLVTGCSTDAPQQVETPALTPTTRTTEATTAPEETPEPQAISTDPELPAIPEPPVLPHAAKENTEEGALAFAEYWRELLIYTNLSGVTKNLYEASTIDCEYCIALSQELVEYNKSSKYIIDYDYDYIDQPKIAKRHDTAYLIKISAQQSSYIVRHSPVAATKREDDIEFSEESQTGALIIIWEDKRWKIFGYGPFDS